MSELSATSKSTLIGSDENELLHYLHDRYTANHIYTYVGSILIAINPHQQVDNLSVYEQIKDYQQSGDIMPHIFIVGDKAYHDMTKKNQSIIILGELGAGKTETSKCVLQYLTESYSSGNGLMKERFIKCNLLLEAFGNAKTIHNNSSRFGKIIEVHFNNEYQIVGAILSYYLFEKSRVCVQTKGEENYHIFYHLCVNAPEDIRNTLQLSSPHNFYYLNRGDYDFTSKQVRNPRPDNITDFIKYDRIMDCIGISQQDKFNIYNTLALILHLGNINFENDPKNTQYECKIISMSEQALTITAKLLNVHIDDLRNALTTKISMTNKAVISCPLTVLEAQTVRDKLAKTIYARLFNQIVDFVNKSISFNSSTSYISIHDTIGFEYVHIGSFVQFCINYYHEKMHKFRNDHLLKNEILCEEEYRILNKLGFTNTEECINLFEAPITGCFYLLDEESKLLEPTSANFTNEVYSKNKGHAKLKPPQILTSVTTTHEVPDNHDFLIQHFSGDVSYSTTRFVEKNIDILPYSLTTLIQKCKNDFLENLFQEILEREQNANQFKCVSVGSMIQSQSINLINKLKTTDVHFIQCITSNMKMIPNMFDNEHILSQLHHSGIMPCFIFLYLRQRLLTIQSYIRMYSKHKQYAPQIRSLSFLNVFYEQMIGIKKLIENLVRKKRNKYIERTKTVTKSMEELIEKIRNTSMPVTEMDSAWDKCISDIDEEFDRLTKVFSALNGEDKENTKLKQSFEKIVTSHEQAKRKKIDEDKEIKIKRNMKKKVSSATSNKPLPGNIYYFTQGVEILFGITPKSLLKSSSFKSLRSTNSSTASLSSSSQQKSPTPRPCLVWDVKEDEIQILAMTSFNGNDPTNEDKVFPELERNFLLKRLLAVSPTLTLLDKASIDLQKVFCKSTSIRNCYLILIPTLKSLKDDWYNSTHKKESLGSFGINEMLYINQLLKDISTQTVVQASLREAERIRQLYSEGLKEDGDDKNHHKSSSSSLDLPYHRVDPFIDDINFDKDSYVQQWLDEISIHNNDDGNESLDPHVDIHDISLSIVNDITQEETLHLNSYKSILSWTEIEEARFRPSIAHQAMGVFILNILKEEQYAKSDIYIGHIHCSDSSSLLMATSKHVLFVNEILFFDLYKVDWQIKYEELKEEPVIISSLGQIQILTKESKKAGSFKSSSSYVKMIRYRNKSEAQYIVDKITNLMMHTIF